MRLLELFCGTKSISKVFNKRGFKTYSLDILKKYEPDEIANILDFNYKKFKPHYFNVIWASPPCTEYSIAKTRGVRNIKQANKFVKRTLKIIEYLKPDFYFIENPRTGYLKEQPFMKNLKYFDVDYCRYGFKNKKPTRIWSNLIFNNPINKLCNHKGSHELSTQDITSLNDRYKIPRLLVIDILKNIINNYKKKYI